MQELKFCKRVDVCRKQIEAVTAFSNRLEENKVFVLSNTEYFDLFGPLKCFKWSNLRKKNTSTLRPEAARSPLEKISLHFKGSQAI